MAPGAANQRLLAGLLLAGLVRASGSGDESSQAQTLTDLLDRPCGISGVLNAESDEYQIPPDMHRLHCKVRMTTNCTVSYTSMTCPSACDFLVPSTAFSCLFECVPRELCSLKNPNRAYPNPQNKICERCGIEGCKLCASQDRCEQCHPHFVLSNGGTKCSFELDVAADWPLVMAVVAAVVLFLIFLAVIWFAVHGPHRNWQQNMTSILRARRHRHLTKTLRWELKHPRTMKSHYSMAENMHAMGALGVGVPLFFNNIVFMLVLSAMFWGVTYMVFHMSSVSHVLSKFMDRRAALWHSKEAPTNLAPAMILSPLGMCSSLTGPVLREQVTDFAETNFWAVGFLFMVSFVLSLYFGLHQKRATEKFDKENQTMSDYVLNITGLPEDETSEPELRKWLERTFRDVCPGEFKRPDEVVHKVPPEPDIVTPRPRSGIEVFGVSICYNYLSQREAIDDIMWKEMELMEVEMHNASGADWWQLDVRNTTAADRGMSLEEVQRENRNAVARWFSAGDQKLRSSGEAFVVFTYLEDKSKVQKYAEANPSFLRHPSNPNVPLAVKPVFSEPNCVAWWFMGIPQAMLYKRTARNFLWILFAIGVVQVVIVFPYAKFILLPYAKTGGSAGGIKMTIAGMVLGNVNGILFITNFLTATKVGYTRKDRMDLFVLFTNTILVLLNTGFNIAVTVVMVLSQYDLQDVLNAFLAAKTFKAVGVENAIALNVYQMLMPGSFFTGLIMAMIMAGWVPFIWISFLMKMIYIWRALPDCLLKIFKLFLPWAPPTLEHLPFRSAEKAFEPWEVAICGNYADQIVTPTVCFCFLFFLSPQTPTVFLGMLLWAAFEYIYFRYMHLRYCKACFYTTSRLDSFNNVLWGLPLSIIASAWCLWALRSERIAVGSHAAVKLALLFLAGLVALLLWLVSYRLVVNPFNVADTDEEHPEKTVVELSQETVYTWFNCNAPFVLKCKYFFQDEKGNTLEGRAQGHPIACGEVATQVRFFEIGKQALFATPERYKLAVQPKNSSLEFETWFEKVLHMFDVVASSCRCGSRNRVKPDDPEYTPLDAKDG